MTSMKSYRPLGHRQRTRARRRGHPPRCAAARSVHAPAEHVIAAVREAAAGTASLSPELLARLTQAMRRPPPPDPFRPLSPRERDVLRLIAVTC
jgi:DNA-binding NarL/FixJ family response regulator